MMVLRLFFYMIGLSYVFYNMLITLTREMNDGEQGWFKNNGFESREQFYTWYPQGTITPLIQGVSKCQKHPDECKADTTILEHCFNSD
jgi:hypothetical protein